MKRLALISISILIMLVSCMDDDAWYELNELNLRDDSTLLEIIKQQSGVFILNEGNFMYDNSSLSYYLIDSMKVYNDVFFRTNLSKIQILLTEALWVAYTTI